MSINLLILFMMITPFFASHAWAEDKESPAKTTTTQNVGGLLFDVDEGVKIEQGPGGSVYVKSNREYMQEKFAEIDSRLLSLEDRLSELEKGKAKKKTDSAAKEPAESPQVLVS
jgi:hypothetical protein